MSLLPLMMVAAVLSADAGYGIMGWSLSSRPMLLLSVTIVPTLILVGLSWWFSYRAAQGVVRLGGTSSPGLQRAAAMIRLCRSLVVLNAILVIMFMGWLQVVRQQVGNPILLDELIAMAPALVGLYLICLAWYPVDRALTAGNQQVQGSSVRRDGRWSFAWSQFSLQVLLLFVPAMMILVVVEFLGQMQFDWIGETTQQLIFMAAVVIIFLGTPLLVRLLLAARPLESGAMRDRLENVCRVHRVRIRDILDWRTGGRVVNAAVVGFVGRLRYVLLTDALLRTMPERYTEAVMAHEVAHVRCRHMPWLFLVIVSLVLAVEALLLPMPQWPRWEGLLHLVVMLGAVWAGFGWVCRRFEWQADAFAAVHMATEPGQGEDPAAVVSAEAVATVIGALEAISMLNGDSPGRYCWRHGSVSWRCRLLADLAGRPRGSLPIDTVVGRIKTSTVFLGGTALLILLLI